MTDRRIDWDRVSRGESAGVDAASASGTWSWSDAPDLSGQWPGITSEGRYLRGTVLAEGGMGAVHLAEDPLLRRQVALKVVRSGADSREAQRLLREARITAALRHPGVAAVLDAGVDEQGRPWFAMPVIPGRTLTALLLATGVTPTQSLKALADAADILGHAHRAGLVHRDVKPANLMVSSDGAVVVLDWGIARPESATTEWDALLTRSDATGEELLGTPAYMSPEQVIGDSLTVRSDVWSLGVCLVEILCGMSPFRRGDAEETMRAVVHGPLPKLEGPLGALVAAALSRDPQQRPADGHAFAAALRAALEPQAPVDESVEVPRRAPVWMAVLALLVGLGVGMGTLWSVGPSAPSEPLLSPSMALLARAAALAGARPVAELVSVEGLELGDADAAVFRGILAAQTPELRLLDRTPLPECEAQRLAPDGSVLMCAQDDGLTLYDLPSMSVRWAHPVALSNVVWSGDAVLGTLADSRTGEFVLYDGRTGIARDGVDGDSFGRVLHRSLREGSVLGSRSDGELSLIDVLSGEEHRLISNGEGLDVGLVLRDGSVVGVGASGVYQWTVPPQSTPDEAHSPTLVMDRSPLSGVDRPVKLAVSLDGRWMVEGSLSGAARVWDLQHGVLLETAHLLAGMVKGVAISPDARWVAAVDELGSAWVWPTGQEQSRVQLPGTAKRVAFPSSDRLRVVGTAVESWVVPEVKLPHVLKATAGVSAVDWAGDWLAAAAGRGQVLRWSTQTGLAERQDFVVTGERVVKDVSLTPSGAVLAGSLDKTVDGRRMAVFWSEVDAPAVENSGCRRVVWLEQGGAACMYLPPGPTVFSMDGTVYDALRRPTVMLTDMELAADRRTAVLIDRESNVLRLSWQASQPELELVFKADSGFAVAAGGPDGQTLVTSDGHRVQLYTDGSDEPVRSWTSEAIVLDLAVSPDGRRVAAGLGSGEAIVWDVGQDAPLAILVGHRERVSGVWFAPDGRQLVTGSWDETVRLWDMGTLDIPVSVLLQKVEARWGRTAEEMLAETSHL